MRHAPDCSRHPERTQSRRELLRTAGTRLRQAGVENVRKILESCGSSLEKVVDVQVFLIDMQRDFAAFNAVYREHFAPIGATRTTVQVGALPTPIAVEFKVTAAP